MFEKYGANVHFETKDNTHIFPIDKTVSDIWPVGSCYDADHQHAALTNCQQDLAGDFLSYLYGNLDPSLDPQPKTDDWQSQGVLRKYDQRQFLENQSKHFDSGFDDHGYVYYPNSCIGKKCKAQILFHGCAVDALTACQNAIPLASANDMIIIMPGAKFCFRVAQDSHHYKDKNYIDKYDTNQGI